MTRALPEPTYRRLVAGLGTLSLRPFDLTEDVTTLHGWVTQPYAQYWGLLNASVADVHAEYLRISQSAHHRAFLGEHDGRAAFLMERYEPAYDAVGRVYDVAPGDIGMHVLVGPAITPIAGFTAAVFETIMDSLFSDPLVDRVVVEPDVRNVKIQALNARMGFRKHSVVQLADKQAWLSFCTRDQYADAHRMNEAG
ncbi:RimJ/RimL family protein N-acetyltransferase [Kribbella rubisoli]|uniref:Lysine N-acyltransferase MbtK n=1 Tax=Kribbella rubisoli TaxID=3075929 RepID=A0A4Q7X6E3_9ACTN|nr:GNAT family N-acetyltransferase [Kribbella rubisoli]RZU18651.1 RimJ/RimL family protein N-acetyltransferase [Kribbella rubisoli]